MEIRCLAIQSKSVRPDPYGRYEIGRVEPGTRPGLASDVSGVVMPALGRFIDDELKHGEPQIFDRDISGGIWRPVIMDVLDCGQRDVSSGEVANFFKIVPMAELIGRGVMYNGEVTQLLLIGALTWVPGYRRLTLFADTTLDVLSDKIELHFDARRAYYYCVTGHTYESPLDAVVFGRHGSRE